MKTMFRNVFSVNYEEFPWSSTYSTTFSYCLYYRPYTHWLCVPAAKHSSID